MRTILTIFAILLITNVTTCSLWRSASNDLVKEHAAHTQTIQDFKTKQEVADARAQAIKETLEKEAKADAKQADANYANLLDRYNASLLRYKAAQSNTIRPDNYKLPTPQSGDRPGESTEFSDEVIISMADAKVCAVNTARLQAVHDWAVNLLK